MYFCALENEFLIIMYDFMKKPANAKVLLLSLMFVTGFVLPIRAQYSDAFFRNDALYENRADGSMYYNLTNQHFGDGDNITYQLYNQHFGQTLPLDGGLLIMIGAGACYIIRKRENRL